MNNSQTFGSSGSPKSITQSNSASVVTTAQIDHNVLVTNVANADATVSYLLQFAYIAFTTANIVDNFVDPSGSFYCFEEGVSGGYVATANFSGNVNMNNLSYNQNQFDPGGSGACSGAF